MRGHLTATLNPKPPLVRWECARPPHCHPARHHDDCRRGSTCAGPIASSTALASGCASPVPEGSRMLGASSASPPACEAPAQHPLPHARRQAWGCISAVHVLMNEVGMHYRGHAPFHCICSAGCRAPCLCLCGATYPHSIGVNSPHTSVHVLLQQLALRHAPSRSTPL